MVMINCIDLHIRQVQFTLRWPLRPVGLLLFMRKNFILLLIFVIIKYADSYILDEHILW